MSRLPISKVLLSLLLVFSLIAAACGDDDDSAGDTGGTTDTTDDGSADTGGGDESASTAKVQEAKDLVAAASAPLSFSAPAGVGPVDLDVLAGKRVAIINLVEAVPILTQWQNEMLEAFEGSGVEVSTFDGNFDPNEWGRGIEQATAEGVDLIFLLGIPAGAVAPQIGDAVAAGIPVMNSLQGTPGKDRATVPELTADVGFDYRIPGAMIAQWFVADSEGQGKALIMSSDDNSSSPDVWGAMEAEIERLCPDCEYSREDSTVPEWGDGTLQNRAKALLQADPEITHILAVFDAMTLAIEPALVELGMEGDVKVAGFNGTPAVLANVQAGTAVKVDVGNPNMWFSAGAVDAVYSVLQGEEPIEDAGVPFRMFWSDNVGDIDTSQEDPVDWYGIDPLAEYRALWGIEG